MTIEDAQAAVDAAAAEWKAAKARERAAQIAFGQAWDATEVANRVLAIARDRLAEASALAADAWRPRAGQYVVAEIGKDRLRLRKAGEPADRARWFTLRPDGTLTHRSERINDVNFPAIVAAFKSGKPAEVKP